MTRGYSSANRDLMSFENGSRQSLLKRLDACASSYTCRGPLAKLTPVGGNFSQKCNTRASYVVYTNSMCTFLSACITQTASEPFEIAKRCCVEILCIISRAFSALLDLLTFHDVGWCGVSCNLDRKITDLCSITVINQGSCLGEMQKRNRFQTLSDARSGVLNMC